MPKGNRYSQIIEAIFFNSYKKGIAEIPFTREDIELTASKLEIKLPKNLGDLLYSFRYRTALPKSITDTAPEGFEWIIRSTGGLYINLFLQNRLILNRLST